MAGADEGDDVRPHLEVGQALPGLRDRSPSRSSVSRSRGRRAAATRAAPCGRRSARSRPPRRSAAPAGPGGGRSAAASRQAEDVERVDRPDRLEIARDRAAERIRIARQPCVKIVRSSTSSVTRVISSATSTGRPSPRRRSRRTTRRSAASSMAGAKPADVRGVKSGASARRCARHSSPSAVSRPFAEARRQHAPLQVVLAVVRGVVDEHVADRGRVAQHRDAAEHALRGEDRLLEMRLASRSSAGSRARLQEGEEVGRAVAEDAAPAAGRAGCRLRCVGQRRGG